nr:receptor kinase-like protein Xa21 [Tanacetum cinerariifolium]
FANASAFSVLGNSRLCGGFVEVGLPKCKEPKTHKKRIKILMDVASALDYLHSHIPTTVIHGDLKPSNILLDDDMVAHVGDFGLARFLEADLYQNSSTGIRGTIGYMPPGIGGDMTSSGDVYSFGILLLEVMTDFVRLNVFQEDATAMQQTVARSQIIQEVIVSTVKIGVSCSEGSPQQRMNMENVVRELQHILDMLQNILRPNSTVAWRS